MRSDLRFSSMRTESHDQRRIVHPKAKRNVMFKAIPATKITIAHTRDVREGDSYSDRKFQGTPIQTNKGKATRMGRVSSDVDTHARSRNQMNTAKIAREIIIKRSFPFMLNDYSPFCCSSIFLRFSLNNALFGYCFNKSSVSSLAFFQFLF